MKRFLAIAGAVGLFSATTGTTASAAPEKVTVCHATGDNVNDHVISISERALPAHLAHGDEESNLPPGSACVIDGDPET
jgi:hypothetical protein